MYKYRVYCCLLYICVTTVLNATFVFVFYISYCNVFRPHLVIMRRIYSLLKLLQTRLSMSRVKVFLFLILIITKSFKIHKIANPAAMHLVVSRECFACCGSVWISTHC
jgi:hypothetical protein